MNNVILRVFLVGWAALLCLGDVAWVQATESSYAWQQGPLEAPLGEQATLKLSADYRFLGPKDTERLLQEMGNFPSGAELGLVTGNSGDSDWFVVIRFIDAGYVEDNEATEWDADEMLTSIKEGTEEANAKRREMGMEALTIKGWEEKPHYDKATNKVVWAIAADTSQGTTVNYNTLALGRHGYMSMNLVADLSQLPALKSHAASLLSNLNFVQGKRYVDFDRTTDKVAAVGLAALIAGAAFKSGLFAKLLVLIFAFKKAILLAGAALIGLVWKLVKGRSSTTPSA